MFPDYEKIDQKVEELIYKYTHCKDSREDYREIYDLLGIGKVTFEISFEKDSLSRVMGPEFIMEAERSDDGSISVYESDTELGDVIEFVYPLQGRDDIKAKWYLKKKTDRSLIDEDRYRRVACKMYLMKSVSNMRTMLEFARLHDSQSGIPNGVGIKKLYKEAQEANPDVKYTVIYANLRNFKYINERIGVRGGDEAIIQFARRLTLVVEPDEGVCRLGGDNFLLFVKPDNLDHMIKVLSNFEIDNLESAPDKSFTLSSWLGIDVDMDDSDEDSDFGVRIERASIANTFARQKIKQPVVYYNEQFSDMMNTNKHIASIFMPGLKSREFQAFFQAKVNMRTGDLIGFETLCRWRHKGEFIFPDQFIPVIDRLGLIYELDMEMLRITCESVRKWLDLGLNPPVLSVNFSRKDIFIPDVEQQIKKVVDSYEIMPAYIEIEITETATEAEYARIIEFVRNLKNMGFRIAVDDFGTGYSSLSLIHNINADTLKIDKSFVTAIHKDAKTEILVSSIINIAERLNMELVAEGVETDEEGRKLMELGCEVAQGYYYSRPTDYDATTTLIRERPFKPIFSNPELIYTDPFGGEG